MSPLTLIRGSKPDPGAAVLGIDWSLAATGMCRIYPDGIVAPWTVKSTGKADWSMKQRAERVRTVAQQITAGVLDTDRVIVEGSAPSRGAESGKEDLALLRGLVTLALLDRGIPMDVMSPGTLKKWGTGSGKASKDQIGLYVGRLFPDLALANNNEVDAVVLAHCAAVRAGYPVPTRVHHSPANYAAVRWESPAG